MSYILSYLSPMARPPGPYTPLTIIIHTEQSDKTIRDDKTVPKSVVDQAGLEAVIIAFGDRIILEDNHRFECALEGIKENLAAQVERFHQGDYEDYISWEEGDTTQPIREIWTNQKIKTPGVEEELRPRRGIRASRSVK